MVSKNIDVVLSTRNINRLFQWRTKLLFSYVKDYITNTQDVLQPAWAYCDPTRFPVVPNRPRYGVYSFPFTGLDIDGQPMGLNKNKDYTSMVTVPGYSTLIFHGRATPAVFGSITNEFSWKQFNLSVSLFYKLDYYFREPSVFYPGIFDGSSPTTADFQKRWQKPGDEKTTYVPRMIFPPNNNRDNFYVYSSILVKRADNIKLQNIHLSYDFEGNALRKLRLRMANIYFNASNMGIIWRMKKSTIDPDYINGFREPAMLTLGFKGTFR
jgi:hypothetical protein